MNPTPITDRITRRQFAARAATAACGVAAAAAGGARAQTELPGPPPATPWAHGARILSAQYRDVPNLKRAREEFGATVMLLYCCPETTNGWCPAGTWDQVAFFIRHAHEHGLKVVCYYDTTTVEESFVAPERRGWVQTTLDGKPCTFNRPHVWHLRYALCHNTPWSDHVARVARRYVVSGADGIFLDNPQYYSYAGTTCFCAHCRREYARETGADLAQAAEGARIAWHQKSLREHVKRVYGAAHEAAPDRSLVITCNTSNPKLPMQRLDSLGRAENVIFRETGAHKKAREHLQADAAVFPRKPLWVILTERSGSKVWSTDPAAAAAELDPLLGTVIELGLCPMVWATIPSQDPLQPGFTQSSIYNRPELGAVVARHFRSPKADR